ncbi:hypothetical protein GCM10023091_15180 [Ravibacter arvi]|uniref:Transposase zinc-ribbon domain-containing protein n=1 Tax=Ravibacter arvi TaxID=2051041 RepID=A0ABP8LVQ8_9BACT
MLPQELLTSFKNEALAEEAFKGLRLRKGVTCKKCGGRHHYWLASKKQFQCKQCRFRTTLQSGTVLQGSKLPVSYFFIGLQMLMEKGKRISIEEFQKETGHKYYDPLWDFVHKLKDYVRKNEPEVLEKDFTEVVDTYFVTHRQVS